MDKARLPTLSIKKFLISTHYFSSLSDWRKSYGEELYDHSIDPQETMNLAGRTELATIKLNLKKLLKQTVIQ